MTERLPAHFPDPQERTPTILVVDDEILIRIPLADYLQECGFKVLEASSADEAVEILDANTSIIDLVFTDIRMPGSMDGFGLAKWIRANRPEVQVVLASGGTKATMAEQLCAQEPFFAKPYELKLVVEKIRQLLALRKSSSR